MRDSISYPLALVYAALLILVLLWGCAPTEEDVIQEEAGDVPCQTAIVIDCMYLGDEDPTCFDPTAAPTVPVFSSVCTPPPFELFACQRALFTAKTVCL